MHLGDLVGLLRVVGTAGYRLPLFSSRAGCKLEHKKIVKFTDTYAEPLTVSMVSDVTPSTTSTGAVGSS